MILTPRDILAYVGDSITYEGWFRKLNKSIRTALGRSHQWCPPYLNLGIGAKTIAQWTASIDSWITPYQPTAIILKIGHNSASGTITADMNALIDAIRARWATIKLLMVSVGLYGEDWPNGANGADVEMDAKKAAQQVSATAKSVDFVDVRTAYFAALPTANSGHLAQGVYTRDGIHHLPLGQDFESNVVWQSGFITVSQ